MLKDVKIHVDEYSKNVLLEIDQQIKETLDSKPEWANSLSKDIKAQLEIDESFNQVKASVANSEQSIKNKLKDTLTEDQMQFFKEEILLKISESITKLDELKSVFESEKSIEALLDELRTICNENKLKIELISNNILQEGENLAGHNENLFKIRDENLIAIEKLCIELKQEIKELQIPWYKKIFKRRT